MKSSYHSRYGHYIRDASQHAGDSSSFNSNEALELQQDPIASSLGQKIICQS